MLFFFFEQDQMHILNHQFEQHIFFSSLKYSLVVYFQKFYGTSCINLYKSRYQFDRCKLDDPTKILI